MAHLAARGSRWAFLGLGGGHKRPLIDSLPLDKHFE